MRTVENFMNRLTDMDSGWWPFLHLKPATSQLMDNRLLVKMSLYYGSFYGAVFSIITVLPDMAEYSLFAIVSIGFVTIVFLTVFFFIAYKYSFAIFWNRRACRLQEKPDEPEAS